MAQCFCCSFSIQCLLVISSYSYLLIIAIQVKESETPIYEELILDRVSLTLKVIQQLTSKLVVLTDLFQGIN